MASRKARRLIAVAASAVTAAGLGVVGLVLTQQASAATVDTSGYYVLKNRASGKVLDVYEYSKADGARIDQWSQNNGDWQQFQFLDMGSGYYRLKAKHSGKVVSVASASKAEGAQAVQSTGDSKAAAQQFELLDMGSGYYRLKSRNSGKVLAVEGGSTADGANVVQTTGDSKATAQQWSLVKAGSSGSTGGTTSPTAAWPAETGSQKVSSIISVPKSGLDGGNKRYYADGGGQEEGQDPIFELADGATLSNVIIGSPAADGVHCKGSCTLKNVWWLDVGEDAATFLGGASATYTVDGGGAKKASDKVFQHNGGGTLTIKNFQVEDFGKLYRSCGNCKSGQQKRTVVVQNVTVTAPGKTIVGINTNYGDTATLSGITIIGDSSKKISICDRFTGNSTGAEPPKTGSGPDGTYCKYSTSAITYK
ncbi:pectate lyase [Actinoplanes sp. RD1]|uniref:pectate lyase n=1 Tax=Actinoplanes sp. RD1 TaxID=3064538 RepID=UPI00274076AE|nr:pectate lyase [Actinoplanes sp. RD1]